MTQFASRSQRAEPEFAVNHDSSSNSRAQGKEEHGRCFSATAKGQFTQSCSTHIVE